MSVMITTRYETHAGSNVGKYVARSLGRQATVRTDQSRSSEANHREAAWRLAQKLRELGIYPPRTVFDDLTLAGVENDGRHVWTITEEKKS